MCINQHLKLSSTVVKFLKPFNLLFTPDHQYGYSLYCSLNISLRADEENLCNNQELLLNVISYFSHNLSVSFKAILQ